MAQHFIGGRWVGASSGQTLPVLDPATGEPFDTIPRGTAADIDAAVRAARAARRGAWGRMTAAERGRILLRMSALILARHEELARLEARDTGKPMSQARNDIAVAARYCEFYGGAADKLHGEHLPYLNDFVTFTGSPEVGTVVQKAAAERTLKCVLELGGKSPHLVFDDADLERTAGFVIKAITQNAGQTCSAGSRLLVQRSIYDEFTAMVAERFRATVAGTPDQDRDCGPLINQAQQRRVQGFVDRARAAGIPVLAQGRVAEGVHPGGFYVAPTLFGAVPRTHELACDEVFGPVLAAMPFEDEADAIDLANATDYGLIAAVWTRDGGRQTRVARALQCGQVYVNSYGAGGGVELPFGGVKKSGHGREKGFLALQEFCTVKTIVQYHGA